MSADLTYVNVGKCKTFEIFGSKTFVTNYFGNCPLRLEDGRCGVQAELGEDILPDICRLYPRGVRRLEDHYEISLSNSCEAVPELFLHRKEPIAFIERQWTMKLPPMPADELGSWQVRKGKMDILQDHSHTLPQRLGILGAKETKPASEDTLAQVAQMVTELSEHSGIPYFEYTETADGEEQTNLFTFYKTSGDFLVIIFAFDSASAETLRPTALGYAETVKCE